MGKFEQFSAAVLHAVQELTSIFHVFPFKSVFSISSKIAHRIKLSFIHIIVWKVYCLHIFHGRPHAEGYSGRDWWAIAELLHFLSSLFNYGRGKVCIADSSRDCLLFAGLDPGWRWTDDSSGGLHYLIYHLETKNHSWLDWAKVEILNPMGWQKEKNR